jgi:hypothetical protein
MSRQGAPTEDEDPATRRFHELEAERLRRARARGTAWLVAQIAAVAAMGWWLVDGPPPDGILGAVSGIWLWPLWLAGLAFVALWLVVCVVRLVALLTAGDIDSLDRRRSGDRLADL